MSSLVSKIEAVLFFKGEHTSIRELSNILNVAEADVKIAIDELRNNLEGRGIVVMSKDDSVKLATAPEHSVLIEGLLKEELSKDLGKAGLEVLSIILYKQPVARSQIDYIRGVNSTYTIRTLLMRGLIERISNPKDSRSNFYKPTFELLSFLGISNITELPEYKQTRAELEAFEKQTEEELKENKEE